MTISDKAIEAALDAFGYEPVTHEEMRAALEAAAPFIRAQALEDAADDAESAGIVVVTPSSLRARAAAERGGE